MGGPVELDAPRPLSLVEQSIWCLLVAAALEDFGIPGQVWPSDAAAATATAAAVEGKSVDVYRVEFAVAIGETALSVVAFVPRGIELRQPPARPAPTWAFDIPIVVARAAIPRAALATLAVRDIITVERTLELEIGDGAIALRAAPKAVEATVATGYVRRDMALPDDAHLELTVQLGTRRLSLRELSELVPGQIIPLGRPLSGPFDVRAGGRTVGQGELIDIDGEIGVRIVSLASE